VIDAESVLSEHGRLVEACWLDLRNRFSMVELDAYVIMPNHIHGMIAIARTGALARADPPIAPNGSARSPLISGDEESGPSFRGTAPHSLASKSFKSESTKAARRAFACPELLLWQRGYYEHVVRGYKSLDAIRRYINENPLHWRHDPDNPDRER
jgi:REP element-mobilizing transposase RayT